MNIGLTLSFVVAMRYDDFLLETARGEQADRLDFALKEMDAFSKRLCVTPYECGYLRFNSPSEKHDGVWKDGDYRKPHFFYTKTFAGQIYCKYCLEDVLNKLSCRNELQLCPEFVKIVTNYVDSLTCWMEDKIKYGFQSYYYTRKLKKIERDIYGKVYFPSGKMKKDISSFTIVHILSLVLIFYTKLKEYEL